ncbi:leucine-rich repeat-containing protein 52-like isoform X2 [Erinaceus europaeus]|uniref:Leucine-rich repeat-containing protein 52-like isoform X2 n=1 Tax=Erinaceus europaeus TaxID=9365 RepID=A0ABM3XZC7_ERIEU|nr:leucine-rich repeat-containing protein 52-like isoform X2 [Erinaceus europaeus]
MLQLNLSHNPQVRAVPFWAFTNASALRLLDLCYRGLHSLDQAALSGLPDLHSLYRSGNPWRCNSSLVDFTIYLLWAHLSLPDGVNYRLIQVVLVGNHQDVLAKSFTFSWMLPGSRC